MWTAPKLNYAYLKIFAVLDDEISPEDDDADPYVDEQVEENDDLDDIQGIL